LQQKIRDLKKGHCRNLFLFYLHDNNVSQPLNVKFEVDRSINARVNHVWGTRSF